MFHHKITNILAQVEGIDKEVLELYNEEVQIRCKFGRKRKSSCIREETVSCKPWLKRPSHEIFIYIFGGDWTFQIGTI